MVDSIDKLRGRSFLWVLPLLLGSCKTYETGDQPGPVWGIDQDSGIGASGSKPDVQVPVLTDLDPRALDILLMVDNSPSMDPKQVALAAAFPKMLEELQKIPSGMPNLHIGVVSSDMGAGAGEAGGNCSVVLGNQGILWGNDPNADPDSLNNKKATVKRVKNAAGASGCGMDAGTRWIEDVQNEDGSRGRNYQGNLTDVLSCLSQAVGVNGCGYEHQLQSVRVALNPQDNINSQNVGFLRPKAYLAIVLVTDEDDCSADPGSETNDAMYMPRTLGDTASLRCAARGHVCNGKDIPNYDPAQGYSGKEFSAKFADCDAKDDTGSPRDYKKLPLIRIRDMIDSVNQVKAMPDQQILAAGIIGWPQGSLDGVAYRIEKDTTSMPVEQQKLWDYMPVCKVPGVKSSDGNIYKAYGGLRLKKFLDAFKKPSETNVFSVCNPDFSEAMTQIGKLVAQRLGG